jgi:iron complex outermembrane recepter protein
MVLPRGRRNRVGKGISMSMLKSRFALCASTVALAFAQLAYGENDAASAGTRAENLESVVVVGEKFGRTVKETAASVSVVGAKDIDANVLLEGRDAFEQMANVTIAENNSFHIRGVSFDNVNGAGYGALGTLYVDNVRMSDKSTQYGPDMLWDVQSVEVLRGAQSTMQGRNALAGAIYITSQEPTFDWQAKARALVSNGNGWDLAAAASGPILDDVLAFRISGEARNFDGFIYNPILNTHKIDFSKDYQFRGKLLFKPSSDLTIHLNLNYADVTRRSGASDTRVLGSDGYLVAGSSTSLGTEDGVPYAASPFRRVSYNDVPEFDYNRTYAGALVADYRLSDALTLTSETTASRDDDMHQRDTDDGYFKYNYTGGSTITLSDPFNIRGPRGTKTIAPVMLYYEDTDSFSQELRMKYDSGDVKAVFGLYGTKEMRREDNYTEYMYRHLRNTVVAAAGSYGVGAPISNYFASFYSDDIPVYCYDDEPVDVKNWAVYGELEYKLWNRLTLIAGARYDSEWNKSGVIVSGDVLGLADPAVLGAVNPQLGALASGINGAINPFSSNSSFYAEQNFSAFLPKFSVRYDFSDDVSGGVVVQRAYRAGGVSLNVYRQLVTNLKPEYTTNYEGFVRAALFDNAAHLEANVYLTDWKDQQVKVDLSDKQTDVMGVNAGSSRLYGGELQFGAQLVPEWSVYGSLGYAHTEFLDFKINVPSVIGALGIAVDTNSMNGLKGNFFGDAPEWTAALGGEWRSADGYFASLGVRFQGASYSDTANRYKNDARTLVNARVGVELDRYTVSVFARNLFDVDYISQASATRPEVGQPRVFGASVEAHL